MYTDNKREFVWKKLEYKFTQGTFLLKNLKYSVHGLRCPIFISEITSSFFIVLSLAHFSKYVKVLFCIILFLVITLLFSTDALLLYLSVSVTSIYIFHCFVSRKMYGHVFLRITRAKVGVFLLNYLPFENPYLNKSHITLISLDICS